MLFKVKGRHIRSAACDSRWGPSNYLQPLNKQEEKKTVEYYFEWRAMEIVQWTALVIYYMQGTLLVKSRGEYESVR